MDSKQIYDYIIKIQAIAKIGLVYSKDPYAITNYQFQTNLHPQFHIRVRVACREVSLQRQ